MSGKKNKIHREPRRTDAIIQEIVDLSERGLLTDEVWRGKLHEMHGSEMMHGPETDAVSSSRRKQVSQARPKAAEAQAMVVRSCPACGAEYGELPGDPQGACKACRGKLPWGLLDAVVEPSDYLLGSRTGQTIKFGWAEIFGPWVHLSPSQQVVVEMYIDDRLIWSYPDGLDVRIDEITWIAVRKKPAYQEK